MNWFSLFLFFLCGVSAWAKAYYHFLLFKKKKNSDISFLEMWFNPFSNLYTRVLIFFPFYLYKEKEEKLEFKKLRSLVIVFSWVSFMSFIILMVLNMEPVKLNL